MLPYICIVNLFNQPHLIIIIMTILSTIIVIFLNLVFGLTIISSIKEMTREEKIYCVIAQSILMLILAVVI